MMVGALFDGFVVGRRADPETAGWGSRSAGGCGCSCRSPTLHDDDQGGVERLLATTSGITPRPGRPGRDRGGRGQGLRAGRLAGSYPRRGGGRAGVTRRPSVRPSRGGAGWRARVAQTRPDVGAGRRATVLALPDVEMALRAYLEAFVGLARSDPDLTSAFLNDVLRYSVQHGARSGTRRPRSHAPLPEQIAKVLEAYEGGAAGLRGTARCWPGDPRARAWTGHMP